MKVEMFKARTPVYLESGTETDFRNVDLEFWRDWVIMRETGVRTKKQWCHLMRAGGQYVKMEAIEFDAMVSRNEPAPVERAPRGRPRKQKE